MAPSKFEKYIKERLEEREIHPSENAWKRVSGQLEVSESPKVKPFYRYAIAASFVGLLLISLWWFNKSEPSGAEPLVNEEGAIESVQEPPPAFVVNEETIEETVKVKDGLPIDTSVRLRVKPHKVLPEKVAKSFETEPLKTMDKVKMTLEEDNEQFHNKITEIVAQVEQLEKGNTVVTEAEIDILLRRAQEEIIKDRIIGKDNSVDAMALLADVEDELDKSFRDQIFEALKDGYIKVRTAVADRNK